MSDAHAEGEHPKVNYMGIFWILVVLTVAEVGVVYVPLPKLILAVILIAFALAKAVLVAAYFMHLKFEKKTMWLIASAPMIFATIMTVGLIPDSEKGLQGSDKDPDAFSQTQE